MQVVLGWPAWSVCHTIKGQNILSGVTWLSAGLEHAVGSCPNSLRSTHQLFGLDEVQLRKWGSSQCCGFRRALSSVLCSSQPSNSKKGFFKIIIFIFCLYCRVNTTPREWTAGFSSSPEPTDRIICWVSAKDIVAGGSLRVCCHGAQHGMSLRASSHLWNLLILGTRNEYGKLRSCAPEPELNLTGFGKFLQKVSARSVVSTPYTHKYVIIVLQHPSKWGVNHSKNHSKYSWIFI